MIFECWMANTQKWIEEWSREGGSTRVVGQAENVEATAKRGFEARRLGIARGNMAQQSEGQLEKVA